MPPHIKQVYNRISHFTLPFLSFFPIVIYYGLNVCVPYPNFICWDSNPQCDDIERWDFWERIRIRGGSWRWSPYEWVECPFKSDKRACFLSLLFSLGGYKKSEVWNLEESLHHTWPCQYPDLGLNNLQKGVK